MFTSYCFLDQHKVSHIHTPTKIVQLFFVMKLPKCWFSNLFCVGWPLMETVPMDWYAICACESGSKSLRKKTCSSPPSWDLDVGPLQVIDFMFHVSFFCPFLLRSFQRKWNFSRSLSTMTGKSVCLEKVNGLLYHILCGCANGAILLKLVF